jgi:multidrug efflux system membrane fusion protein
MNKKSYLIAAAVGLALVVWMLSGLLIGNESDSQAQPAATSKATAPMRVEVETHTAEPVELSIENQGDTQALHDIQLRAETMVVRLAAGDRDARQAEAQAAVAQAQADFDAAERLQGEGYQSSIAVSGAQAALAAAKARLKTINQEITDTRIRAPIDGVLESRAAEVGDYVSVGDAVARILVNDPLIVVAQVAQQDINAIELGREAEVELATGDTLTGRVRYISAAAESGSRTFRVEIEADNPDGVPAGVSAARRGYRCAIVGRLA